MKLLISGAGGFVGAAVARQAVAAGHVVTATIRPGSSRERLSSVLPDIRLAELDLRDPQAVTQALREARPDAVIHVAWSGVDNTSRLDRLQMTDNIDSSCSLLDAAVAAGAGKFVGFGSQGEYGLLSGKISERDLPNPTSLYGAAKLAVMHLTRQLAVQAGMSHAWLRLFSTFGPGDKPNWLIPSLIETMLRGERPRTTLGTQLWDYLYIDDVARAALAVATEPAADGVYNLGSGRPVAVRDIVQSIRDQAAPGMELLFGEIPYGPNQIWHMEADISRLNDLGWSPITDLDAGLATTIAWHRAQRTRHEQA